MADGVTVDARALEEVRRVAVPVTDPAFDRLIADLVAGAGTEVVSIGESHHFVHETFAIRSRVLDQLGRLGFTRIGLELSPHDGRHLDAYLRTGDRSLLGPIGLFGARGRDDRPQEGILGRGADRYPHTAMRTETTRWLDHLRADDVDWSLFGFDVDYLPGLAAEHLDPPSGTAESAESAGTDEDTHPDPRHLLASLDESRRYDRAVRTATRYEDLAEPMAWREDLMARHVGADRARHRSDRTVLIGHNLHISAGSDRIVIDGGVGPGGGLTAPLGTQLARQGIAGPCLWTLHDHGDDSGPPPGDGTVRSVPGTLNATLATLGDTPVAIPTGPVEALHRPWSVASMYGATVEVTPADVCDLIVVAPVTTRLAE